MLTNDEISRFSRHLLLPEIGNQGQQKIKNAKVLVIGAGGLGCPALLYLTAAGVGEIGVMDHDTIDISNLQRQVLFDESDVGKYKSEVASRKLSLQNSETKFNVYKHKIDNNNAIEIINKYDIVIDGTDNFASRYLINDACFLADKPLVYGSVFRFEGQLSVFNYAPKNGTKGPTYRCIFPDPPPPESSPNCSQIGVLGVLPGLVGTLQACEAIKIITGIGDVSSGKLILINLLKMDFAAIAFSRNDEHLLKIGLTPEKFINIDYEFMCGVSNSLSTDVINMEELDRMINEGIPLQLVDVRELHEQPDIFGKMKTQIPLSILSGNIHLIEKDRPIVIYCQSGKRSKIAVDILKKEGIKDVYSLKGGAIEWLSYKK